MKHEDAARTETEAACRQLVQDILTEAERQGADQAEVSASIDSGLQVSVRKGELENLEFNRDRGFGITLYLGKRKGSASTTDDGADAIRDTVAAALRIARYTQEDPCNGLADPDLSPAEAVELDLYHPWEVSADDATALAIECETAGLEVDPRLTNSDGAQVSTNRTTRVYGNSNGFIGAYSGTRQGISCVLIGEDDNGMQRDYWYTVARDADDLEEPGDVGREAGRRTVARLSPRKAPTGTFPVLFSAQVASGFIGHLIGAISGGALYRKASFLLDSMGKSVLPSWLSLVERPYLRKAMASAYFDGDGVATREKSFVDQGVVASYVLSTYSARKLGLTTTGNAGGIYNLDVDGTQTPFDSMVSGISRGLYITELMGQGVNGVTGDYSRGAAGFWIEQGEIAYPVAEVTVAGNLKDMYRSIAAIGDDVEMRSNIRSPSILVENVMLAGDGA